MQHKNDQIPNGITPLHLTDDPNDLTPRLTPLALVRIRNGEQTTILVCY